MVDLGAIAWFKANGAGASAVAGVADDALVSVLLALRAPLMMPMMTGKTNIRPVDGPAVTDCDEH